MVFVLFVEKIVYDIRVKSDFILFDGISPNNILLLTLLQIQDVIHQLYLQEAYSPRSDKN
jgi:hypothetical protein